MLRSVDEENVRSELKPKEDAKRAIEPKQKKKKDDKAFSEQHPSGKRFDDLVGDDYALPDESDPAWDEALEVFFFFCFFFCFFKKMFQREQKVRFRTRLLLRAKVSRRRKGNELIIMKSKKRKWTTKESKNVFIFRNNLSMLRCLFCHNNLAGTHPTTFDLQNRRTPHKNSATVL